MGPGASNPNMKRFLIQAGITLAVVAVGEAIGVLPWMRQQVASFKGKGAPVASTQGVVP